MRVAHFGHLTAEMHDDLTWTCRIKSMADYLTYKSKQMRQDISPGSGSPLSVVFATVARDLGATKLEDDTELDVVEERVY